MILYDIKANFNLEYMKKYLNFETTYNTMLSFPYCTATPTLTGFHRLQVFKKIYQVLQVLIGNFFFSSETLFQAFVVTVLVCSINKK